MKRACISEKAYPQVKEYLINEGYALTELVSGDRPYPSISAHPDIYMCKCGDRVIMNDHEIPTNYPDYLGYNGVFMDGYFIHNLKFTAPKVLAEAEKLGCELIHVNQGYTKCSCVVVDGKSIITADNGIVSALKSTDIEVLQIQSGFVHLEGFDYGFLGGASGRVGDSVVFNGDLEAHPDYEKICSFITDRGLRPVYFKGLELNDIGSIIAVN